MHAGIRLGPLLAGRVATPSRRFNSLNCSIMHFVFAAGGRSRFTCQTEDDGPGGGATPVAKHGGDGGGLKRSDRSPTRVQSFADHGLLLFPVNFGIINYIAMALLDEIYSYWKFFRNQVQASPKNLLPLPIHIGL